MGSEGKDFVAEVDEIFLPEKDADEEVGGGCSRDTAGLRLSMRDCKDGSENAEIRSEYDAKYFSVRGCILV